MIEAYSGESIRAAEQPLLDEGYGDVLMRRAALGLARGCEAQLRLTNRRGLLGGTTAVLLVGSGNNGGDGLWAGAFLRRSGVKVVAILTGTRVQMTTGARDPYGRMAPPLEAALKAGGVHNTMNQFAA
mgnify:CR=1 FL=1